jgi:hypothetical protein
LARVPWPARPSQAGVLHQRSHAVQGAIVFGLFAVGTITQVALSRFGRRLVVLAGLGLLLAALALIVAALAQAISAFFAACYAGLIIPVVGVGVLSEFTGTWAAVLAFSVLLALLCLFSIARIVRAAAPADGR